MVGSIQPDFGIGSLNNDKWTHIFYCSSLGPGILGPEFELWVNRDKLHAA